MEKISDGRYSALFRDDYLVELHKASKGAGRDACIRTAIEEYLALPENVRDDETYKQTIRITFSDDEQPPYTMLLTGLDIPDELVARLLPGSVHGLAELDRHVNTAIRLWLVSRGVQGVML